MVKQSEDRYIYDAVKKGVELELPEEIAIGVDTTKPKLIERRKEWNKPANEEYALPTEIWREVVDRRKRYNDVKNKIDNGNVQQINDFITYNLNIRQFAQDVIENTNDPEFLKHYYKALNNVTILDPTCGSGAFLFAALNILEPLYEGCLQRMEIFLEEAKNEDNYKHLSPELQKSWKSINHEKSWFRQVLSQVNAPEHPNRQYFIYKSIILRNLYGVDIMKEAVEIAKLRLFLKLVATVETNYLKPNLGLEPLPDIDFNIRAGNTLVGFATEKELETGSLDFQSDKEKVLEEMEKVSMAFERFKAMQLSGDKIDHQDFKKAKEDYQKQLDKLKDKLNHSYFNVFGDDKKGFEKWIEASLPFHWFAEYYEQIYKQKGFDVIIGNPPYVEYTKVRSEYKIINFQTEGCGNLYAFVIEKSHQLLNENAYFGMIIPLSISCGERMAPLRKFASEQLENIYISNFEIFPSKLFEGAFQRVTIITGRKKVNENNVRHVSKLHRWYSIERKNLIDNINYTIVSQKEILPLFGKYNSEVHLRVIERISESNKPIVYFIVKSNPKNFIYYQEATNYWMKAATRIPFYKKDGKLGNPAHGRFLYFEKGKTTISTLALLNSSLFYLWYITYSDGFHLSEMLVKNFPTDENLLQTKDFLKLGEKLENDIEAKSIRTTRNTKTNNIEIESFRINLSKAIIDEIDTILAQHYGFTEEELDFIINYDIKYRMGRELEEDV
jgi:hypothetical protein